MRRKDAQHEILVITEAIRLPFDGLDLIVDTFDLPAGNPIVVVGQDTVPVQIYRVGKLLHMLYSGFTGLVYPIVQDGRGRFFVSLVPHPAQFFFQIV